jgi:hypothetical protein
MSFFCSQTLLPRNLQRYSGVRGFVEGGGARADRSIRARMRRMILLMVVRLYWSLGNKEAYNLSIYDGGNRIMPMHVLESSRMVRIGS